MSLSDGQVMYANNISLNVHHTVNSRERERKKKISHTQIFLLINTELFTEWAVILSSGNLMNFHNYR